MKKSDMSYRTYITMFLLLTTLLAYAEPEVESDSTAKEGKDNVFQRIISYFDDTNKPKKQKKFDVSFIGGPHYSSDTKLGIGLVAAGNYYCGGDTSAIPSNVSLYGDISTVGFYLLGVKGTNIFSGDRQRLDYNLYFYSFPTKFWGIGYENGNNDVNESDYKLFNIRASADWFIRLAPGLYAGLGGEFVFNKGTEADVPALWGGESMITRTLGIGVGLKYDTRDNLTNPHKGVLISVTQRFAPRFMGNDYPFSYTRVMGCAYSGVWRGGVLAVCLNAKFNYGNVPWGMLATVGGGTCMRSYYDGRYRDKIAIEGVAELRQHIWRRNSAVIWTGVGTVAPGVKELSSKAILPCIGIGYRWEFKKDCNVRLDYGVGKGESAFTFNINEAF